ncbi:hypothetical protein X801_03685, partial [Opisthorchis viverrini]
MSAINCSPRLGYECAQVLSNHYPERLGLAICIRPGPMFKVAWQAIKPFLPIQTANKVCIVNSKSQLQPTLEQHFPKSIVQWLTEEYNLNRAEPKLSRYRPFWLHRPDTDGSHDPRGDKPYVDNWVVKTHSSGHLPHPNMIDYLSGKLRSTANLMELNEQVDMVEDDEMAEVDEATAKKLLASLPSTRKKFLDANICSLSNEKPFHLRGTGSAIWHLNVLSIFPSSRAWRSDMALQQDIGYKAHTNPSNGVLAA